MSEATNTTLGTIKLAGDLAGSNDAANPRLTDSGVTAGIYTYPKITIDAKGRITNAVNGSSSDLSAIIPAGTNVQKGIVQIGTNINVTPGTVAATYNVDFGGALNSIVDLTTEPTLLGPGLFSISIIVNSTTYSHTVSHGGGTPLDTYSHLFSTLNTLFSGVAVFSKSSGGNILITSVATGAGVNIRKGTDTLLSSLANFVSWPDASGVGTVIIDGSGANTISVNNATSSQKGLVQIGSGLSVSGGVVSVDPTTITKASTSVFGVVKVGSGIAVSGGVISAADATTSVKGVVQIGSGLSVSSGIASLNIATTSVLGGIKIGSGMSVDGTGVLSFSSSSLATTSTAGIMQVGTGLSVTGGLVSVDTNTLAVATTSSKGIMQVGTGLSVTSGVVSVDNAALPTATTSVKGIMQVGSGLAVTSGLVSVDPSTLVNATTSVKGVVQIGSGLAVTAGVVSIDPNALTVATTSVKGIVQVGSGINVAAGVISVPNATTSTPGVVQIGSGLVVAGGLVSSDPSNPALNSNNAWNYGMATAPVVASVSGSYTLDCSLSNTFILTLTGNTTFNSFTNYVGGQIIKLVLIQDATGSRTATFQTEHVFDAAGGKTLSTAANAIDVVNITTVGDGGSHSLCTLIKNFA